MYIFELIFLILLFSGIMLYRNYKGQNVGKFITEQVQTAYDKFAPYSFKMVREKTKELGQEYTPRQYMIQVTVMEVFTAVVTYLYFYNILISLIYMAAVLMVVPYLAYLRCKRVYSEFVFEQIQVYTTNVIMEFNTTQSFVKALEGVRDSGVLENPVLDDVKKMIQMSYDNGTIDESINYFNEKYPYYMVKNMHQLFLQITKEGSRDSGEALENMLLDIDQLVEGVYRDKMDRANFHKRFLTFGIALYLLVMLTQTLLGVENYISMLNKIYVVIILHLIIVVNSYFLLNGEKYYNEDTGGE